MYNIVNKSDVDKLAAKRGVKVERINPPERVCGELCRYRIIGKGNVETCVPTISAAYDELFLWGDNLE